ncbi:MAG: NADH-quinone oxidoreductase subunit N [Dysgonamonadaceae bacterium]|jgi:NADH-quinone oxidoreductase subunit N|nr:NADH-quinone oxidoreductase subunit N [Dysgonamonadaceae bacterium]
MDYSNFLLMQQEISLIVVFLLLLFYDIFGSEKSLSYFQPVACTLFFLHTLFGIIHPVYYGEGFGGMFVNTPISILMKNVLNIGTMIVLLQTGQWLKKPDVVLRRGEFFTITLSTLLGMYFMVSAGNFLMLYIGMELASLPLAILATYNKFKQESAEAGAKFILLASLSSAIMLFGVSYIYGNVGTLYFEDVAGKILTAHPMIIFGFVLFFSGLAFKLSLVPFHFWTPDVYQGAPTSVTAYLSVISKGAATFTLLFVLYRVFFSIKEVWEPILWWLSVITITLGNFFALRQQHIKRFFAFSSISQAGYILLGVLSGTAQGMASTVYFVLIYIFSNLAAFGVITAIENQTGRIRISEYNGLYKTNPKLSLVMMLAVFSLGGIPPFAGFFSKFFIFAAAAEQGQYVLVFIALLNTVISLFYYLLIVKAMFINKSDSPVERIYTDGYNRSSLFICFAGIILIGLVSCIYGRIDALSFGI